MPRKTLRVVATFVAVVRATPAVEPAEDRAGSIYKRLALVDDLFGVGSHEKGQ